MLKLTIKTPERRNGVVPCSSVFIVNFEQVNAGWVMDHKNNNKKIIKQ